MSALCHCRLRQHQRPQHAGEEGQRGGGDRGGLGDGRRGDGRAAVPGREIRPAAPPGVLQVRIQESWFIIIFDPVLQFFLDLSLGPFSKNAFLFTLNVRSFT